MSFAERELEKQVDEMEANGEDSSRVRDQLRGESSRQQHARNRNQ